MPESLNLNAGIRGFKFVRIQKDLFFMLIDVQLLWRVITCTG